MDQALHDAVSPVAFEKRYRKESDPWNYRGSPYEREKYEVTVRSLSREHYGSIFEPACSIGELTTLLAPRCDRLLAIDVSSTAASHAQQRAADFRHVRIDCGDVRTYPLQGSFDLIVFSEVGYYFDVETLANVAQRLSDSLATGGEFIAVHWWGHSPDHVLHGEEVHATLARTLPFGRHLSQHHPGYQLDSWIKP
jgi:cyclopropane fatty-acyl-phospholipid synthase-like methyltransferase